MAPFDPPPGDQPQRTVAPAANLKILALVAVVCWLVIAGLLACTEIQDPDVGLHIAVGRLLLEDFRSVGDLTMGQAPEVLRFAYSYWLYQAIIATAFDQAGAGSIVILRALLILAAFLMVVSFARRLRAEAWSCAVGLAVAVLISHDRFVDRPELISLLAWTAALWILLRHRQGRLACLLVPLQILWVNSHLWFSLLPVLLALFTIGDRIEHRGHLRRGAVLLSALILATFAGPAGPGAWLSQVEILRFLRPDDSLPFAIQEMISPYSAYQPRPAVWVFRIAMPLCILLALRARRRLGWGALLALLFAALLATRTRRAMPLFGLTAGVLLPVALTALRAGLPGRLRRTLPAALTAVTLLAGCIGIYAIVSGRYFLAIDHDTRIALRPRPRIPAVNAARFLREKDVAGPIFHNAVSAGALLLANGDRLSPFLDARWAGTKETIALYQAIREATDETVATDWGNLAEDRMIETVLLDFYEMPALLRWISRDPGWALVYVDETSAVFCRRQGRNQLVIDQCEPAILQARARKDPAREAALAEAVLRFLRSPKPPPWKPLAFPYGPFYRSNYASQVRLPYDAQAAFLELLERENGSMHVSTHRTDILNNVLWTLLDTGQSAAIAALAETVADSPEIDAARRPSLRLRGARALVGLGEAGRAAEIAASVAGDPSANAQERWLAWCMVAETRSMGEDFEGAVEALRSAAKQRPQSAETYRTIGGMLDLKLSRPAEALEAYERFRALGGADTLVDQRISLLRGQVD